MSEVLDFEVSELKDRTLDDVLSDGEALDFSKITHLTDKELDDVLKGYPQPEIDALQKIVLLSQAQSGDTPDAFEAFYELVFGRPIPEHAKDWVRGVYRAHEKRRGTVIEAFRGSTKTTILTILFSVWRIGWEPEKCNLLIQVGDDIATDNSAAVANIIEFNTGFQATFPTVEPDKKQGWGAKGYNVLRTDMPYNEWMNRRADIKDPSFIGVGYKSHDIIGKHPEGVLIIDDINDELNTASERELAKVLTILKETIFPCRVKGTWTVFVGTPWVENDVLHYASATGQYDHIKTPVKDADGNLAWEDKYDQEYLDIITFEVGSSGFARMYMLDLTFSKNKVFHYQLYPSTSIEWNWIKVGGVDYAGTMDEFKNKTGVNDYFAMAYVTKLPGGGAVVQDGVLDRPTQGVAELHVLAAQKLFDPYWQIAVVEGDVRGEDFIQVIRRNPGLRIMPEKTGGKSKGHRLEKQMAPWFENGKVRISDAETPFLNELRHEMDMYPNCTNDDALDAVYWALRGMPDVMVMDKTDDELPEAARKKKQKSPFISLGAR